MTWVSEYYISAAKRYHITNEDPRLVRFTITDSNGNLLRDPPTLVMRVNPSSMSWTREQLVTPIKTIGGYIIQHWGHQLDEISVEGFSPAFYLNSYGVTQKIEGSYGRATGLTSSLSVLSYGFNQYLDLLDLYKHNGLSINNMTGEVYDVGSVLMSYMNVIYTGHFSSFQTTITEENPYSVQYSFVFKVKKEKMINSNVRRGLDKRVSD